MNLNRDVSCITGKGLNVYSLFVGRRCASSFRSLSTSFTNLNLSLATRERVVSLWCTRSRQHQHPQVGYDAPSRSPLHLLPACPCCPWLPAPAAAPDSAPSPPVNSSGAPNRFATTLAPSWIRRCRSYSACTARVASATSCSSAPAGCPSAPVPAAPGPAAPTLDVAEAEDALGARELALGGSSGSAPTPVWRRKSTRTWIACLSAAMSATIRCEAH